MTVAGNIIGAAFVALGALWIAQGVGYVGGSFMSGDPTWALIGAGMAGAGAGVLIWMSFRRLIVRQDDADR